MKNVQSSPLPKNAESKKAIESAKGVIGAWLKSERKIDIDNLPIGESVHLEGIVIINIDGPKRLDQKALLAEEPAIHARFNRPAPQAKWIPEFLPKS